MPDAIDLDALSADERRALLGRLLAERAEAAATAHPLSYGQQAMWFLHRLAPDSPAYNTMWAGRLVGDLDVAAFERAVEALVDRHEALRTTYATPDGEPVQLVHRRRSVSVERLDATGWDDARLRAWLHREADRPFDLRTGPVLRLHLLRRGPREHVLLLAVHHVAIDFWSLDVLLDELRLLYGGAPLPPVTGRYVEHVRWQAEALAGAEGERLCRYWSERLAGELPALQLPTDRPRPPVQTYRGAVHQFALPGEVAARLEDLARASGATPYTTLLTAFAALLHRYTGQEDLLIGSPMAARERPGLEGVVGYLANPVVLRVDVSGDPSFETLLGRVRATLFGALEHQDYPFALLVERLNVRRDPSRTPLFQVSFGWEQARRFRNGTGGSGLSFETVAIGQGGAPLDLMVLVGERDGTIAGALQYNVDLFDAATAARMAGHFETLICSVVADPAGPVSALPLLTDAERSEQAAWISTRVDYDAPACLHELVEAQVRRTPDAVAVSHQGQDTTYADLDRRAGALAGRLRAAGVGPDTVVPLFIDRSPDLVVALLGVLKAGGAFLPLDPAQPTARLAAMLADVCGAPVFVTEGPLLDRLPAFEGTVVRVDASGDAEDSATPPAGRPTDASLAYVIHTSGSTGTPKGAANTHAGIRNRLLWMQEEYRLDASDRVLYKTPVGFDVFVWEVFWPLIAGSRVVVAAPGGHRDMAYLARTIADEGVTTVHFVPSLLRAFLDTPGAADCRALRRVICSGEVLPYELQRRCHDRLDAELYNLYGPAEAAIDVTHHHCRRDDPGPLVPIGRPIPNVRVHLLDGHGQPVPVGVPGEIMIGGTGVGRGYLGRPDLTAARFVPDPFAQDPGARLYRTGDLGRFRPDGAIEYLGRLDEQIKVAGVRVEPHEVEAALDAHPGVRASAVAGRGNGTERTLVACFVAPGEPPRPAELRAFLLDRLPPAMVPAVFAPVGELPRTSSGKVDRRAVAALADGPAARAAGGGPPGTATERVLLDIWRDVLRVDEVGVHDDFFALGGTSTRSVELAVRATEAGLALAPESVFRYGTVARLAEAYGPAIGRPSRAAAERRPEPARAAEPERRRPARNTVIESIGVYLPERSVSTADVIAGCVNEVALPLEYLTGIKTRRVAGDGEYSIDLAERAAYACLARSGYRADEIALVVACNISRYDGPGHRFTFEPGTAVRLRARCGLVNALAFDVSNACAGMFTGIAVADAFLKTGAVQRALVVSGEYITHLTETAQHEIDGYLDARLACLTLGDAGAAVVLEQGPGPEVGFHDIDLCTLSRYSTLCVAKATPGGAIMLSDSVRQTAVAVQRAVPYTTAVMRRHGWQPEDCDHLVMHQTSEASLNDAVTEISRQFGRPVAHRGNTIYNLADRGNTASTTHVVALDDHIASGRIRSGDKVVFGVTGSGQTVGTALYTFDDLPDRLRDGRRSALDPAGDAALAPMPRVAIAGIGTADARQLAQRGSIRLALAAATACLERATVGRDEIGLILHAGVYRDEYLSEPPIAALVAGELKVNEDVESPDDRKTFAFDVLNGGTGFLDACHVATQLIAAGRSEHALVLAAEFENNEPPFPPRGIAEVGSAVLLSRSADGRAGFGRFVFRYDHAHENALEAYTRHAEGRTWLEVERDPALSGHYLDLVPDAVAELLAAEGLCPDNVSAVFPPQTSAAFVTELGERLGIARERFVELGADGTDYFTSSLAWGVDHAERHGLARPGDVGLLIGVGAGLRVGCATYYF